MPFVALLFDDLFHGTDGGTENRPSDRDRVVGLRHGRCDAPNRFTTIDARGGDLSIVK